FRRDDLALRVAAHLAAQLDDLAGELVSHDERRLDALLRPGVPVVDVSVGAADPGGADTDEHLVRTDLRDGDLADRQALAGGLLQNGFQGGGSLARGRSARQKKRARSRSGGDAVVRGARHGRNSGGPRGGPLYSPRSCTEG